MSKLLAALVCQEFFYQMLLLTSVTEALGNIVPWDKNIFTNVVFNPTRSLSTQANHLGFTKPSNYLLLLGLPYFCDFKAGRLQRPRPLSCDFLTLHFPILLHRPIFKAIPAVFIDRIVIESSCAYSLSKYRFQFEK